MGYNNTQEYAMQEVYCLYTLEEEYAYVG